MMGPGQPDWDLGTPHVLLPPPPPPYQQQPQQQRQQTVSMINNPMYERSPATQPQGRKPAPSLAWAPEPDFYAIQNGPDTSNHRPDTSNQRSVHVYPENDDPADDFVQALLPALPGLENRLKWAFWTNMFLVLGHIAVTAYTDPFLSDNTTLQILLSMLQVTMLVLSIMAFFVLTSQTLAVRLGRYDTYLRSFKWLYLTWLMELIFIVATKVYYVVLIQLHYSHTNIWGQPAYYALWVVQRLILCVFWIAMAYASFQALDYRHYDPNRLISSKR